MQRELHLRRAGLLSALSATAAAVFLQLLPAARAAGGLLPIAGRDRAAGRVLSGRRSGLSSAPMAQP